MAPEFQLPERLVLSKRQNTGSASSSVSTLSTVVSGEADFAVTVLNDLIAKGMVDQMFFNSLLAEGKLSASQMALAAEVLRNGRIGRSNATPIASERDALMESKRRAVDFVEQGATQSPLSNCHRNESIDADDSSYDGNDMDDSSSVECDEDCDKDVEPSVSTHSVDDNTTTGTGPNTSINNSTAPCIGSHGVSANYKRQENGRYFQPAYLNRNESAPRQCATCNKPITKVGVRNPVFCCLYASNVEHPCVHALCNSCFTELLRNEIERERLQSSGRGARRRVRGACKMSEV